MKKCIALTIVLLAVMICFNIEAIAQCPMCKLSAESNLRDGGSAGKGLNNGILYMFAMPYLIVGSLAFLWIKNKKSYDSE